MRIFTVFSILLALSSSTSFAAPAVFSGASDVQILQANLDFNGVFKFLTGTADPTVSAPETAPKGSVYCRIGSSGGSCYVKQDAGATTNWLAMPTSPGLSGPGSSTSTAIAKWNGTGGTALSNSGVLIDSSNNLVMPDATLIKFNNTAANDPGIDWQTSAGAFVFSKAGVTKAYIEDTGKVVTTAGFVTQNAAVIDYNRFRAAAGEMIQVGEPSSNASVEVSSTNAATAYTAGMLSVLTNKATNVSVRVQGAASQSADLQQWQNSTPTTLAEITSAGDLNFPASAQGVILKDRSDGHTYRLKVTAGVLGTELVN